MKHIYKGIAICTALATASSMMYAQEAEQTEEQVQVAFRSIDKGDLLGGVSVVDMPELTSKGYAGASSIYFLDNVVAGYNGAMWGHDECLVVIDGMVRDANNVLPHEVEQITLLKGANAVVLYGPRAAKGVLMITTKRGQVSDLKINVTANTGFYVPKSIPEYLGSGEYMKYYNQALANDGKAARYTAEDIYNYGSGVDPYRYPNFNMYSEEYRRKAANSSEANLEVSGGNDNVKYYTTTGYYREQGLLKVGNHEDDYISRFYVRGNTDIRLGDIINVKADANVTFYDSYNARGNWWSNAATLRPDLVSPLIPVSYLDSSDENSLSTINNSNYLQGGGKYFFGGTQQNPTNPYADAFAAGDSKFVSRQFQFNSEFDVNLEKLTQGLMFRAKYGIDYASTYNLGYSNTYATYSPTWTNYAGADKIASITVLNEDKKTGNQDVSGGTYRYTYNASVQFDYTRTFDDVHNVYGIVLGNIWQTQRNGKYHRLTNVNAGAQLSYNYDHKYYVDFSAALPYSTKLPEGNRTAFSPAVTLGWNAAKEDFLEGSVVDDLMLTASASIVNQDLDLYTSDNEEGYYLYKAVMQQGGWYSWGDNGGISATEFQRGDNPNMTFIKRKEINVGLRGSLLEKALTFDVNLFANKMEGGLARVNSLYPIYFTQTGYPSSSIIPYVNYNEDKRSGIDFAIYGNQKFGEFDVTLGLTGMAYKSEASKRDETIDANEQYRSVVGKALNSLWGLECIGMYQSQAEVDADPVKSSFGDVRAGDLRYKDQNGDGKIDGKDEVFLGRWDSPFTAGVNLTVKWRNFTFYTMGNLFMGGKGLKNSSYYWMSGENKYSAAARDCWTPEHTNALYPALTTGNGDHNYHSSDFWMYKTNRFNLSQVRLTYSFDKEILGNIVKGLDVYASGMNLLIVSKEREHMERNIGSSPQCRFWNVGLKASF